MRRRESRLSAAYLFATGLIVPLAIVTALLISDFSPRQPGATAEPPAPLTAAEPVEGVAVAVWFGPNGGAEEAACAGIDAARKEVLVHAYGFTSEPIGKALIAAKKRGLRVELVVDPCNLHLDNSQIDACAHAGIPVFVDHRHAIHHCKILILDGKLVFTGSHNWTKSAQTRNAENLVRMGPSEKLAESFRVNWQHHQQHAERYKKGE